MGHKPCSEDNQSDLFVGIIDAIKAGDLESFNSHMALITQGNINLAPLWGYVDPAGNTVLHLLLTKKSRFKFNEGQRRSARSSMLAQLLQTRGHAKIIDKVNYRGDTVLLKAVKNGYDQVVLRLLDTADITIKNENRRTALEIAATLDRHHIYSNLLKKTCIESNKGNLLKSYSCEQIAAAKEICRAKLEMKRKTMGIIGTIVSIACPVGAVLAFYQWPLLEIFFSMLIPVAGPAIGVVAAVVTATLLFWSIYNKSDRKYGAYAQSMLELHATSAKLDRLEAELKSVNELLKFNTKDPKNLQQRKIAVTNEIEKIYARVEDVQPIFKIESSDWATSKDEFHTYMSATAGFLCAFSGMLGILGGASTYLPAAGWMAAVCLGVPVAGWCALGIAMGVGVVGAWVYQSKFQTSLAECGKSRQELHDKKVMLSQRKSAYQNDPSQRSSRDVAPTSTQPPPQIVYRDPRSMALPATSLSLAQLAGKRGFHPQVPERLGSERQPLLSETEQFLFQKQVTV